MVKMELAKRGRELLGDFGGSVDVRYAHALIFAPAGMEELPDFEALAHFRSELAKNGARPGVMVDSPAILCGPMGKGKVICISPHPESIEALYGIIRGGFAVGPSTPGLLYLTRMSLSQFSRLVSLPDSSQ
jgi:hypothetical protein